MLQLVVSTGEVFVDTEAESHVGTAYQYGEERPGIQSSGEALLRWPGLYHKIGVVQDLGLELEVAGTGSSVGCTPEPYDGRVTGLVVTWVHFRGRKSPCLPVEELVPVVLRVSPATFGIEFKGFHFSHVTKVLQMPQLFKP